MRVKEIEEAVSELPKDELAEFAIWFHEFEASIWDEKIENDLAAGKLDELIANAIAEDKAGNTVSL